jgi:O-antigen ligase
VRQERARLYILQSVIAAGQSRIPIWVWRAAVVLALLGYSLALGLLAGSGRTLYAAVLLLPPLLWLAATFSFRYFHFLVLLLPVAALTMPRIELSTGTETRLPWSMLIALGLTAIWVVSMFLRKNWQLAPSLMNTPLLVFGAITIISFVWGILWRDPGLIDAPKFIITQAGALATILISLATPLLIGNFVKRPGELKYIVGLFIVVGFMMTITQLLRLNQPFLNDRGLWGTWVIAPAYGLLIAQPKLRWYWRAALLVVIGLTFYQTLVVNSFWVSGWLPSILAVVAITFLRSWKLFIGFSIVGALALLMSLGFFLEVAQDNIDDGSLERLIIWEQNWGVVREHWLFGTGPAGYAIYYMSYFPSEARSTHNNYLDILAQFGFSGMFVWIWLMVVTLLEGWWLTQRASPGFLKTLAMIATGGWAAALASMMLGDWILPFAYNQGIAGYKYTVYSWIFLGTLISIRQILDQQRADAPKPEA